MASKKRQFQANVPVAICVRFVLRLKLLEQFQLRELFLKYLVEYADRCGVVILWYALMDNHLHLTVVQSFDGHDELGRIGISPMMRNILSRWVKVANGYFSTEGTLIEHTYSSANLVGNARLIENQVYTLANPIRHRTGVALEDATHTAFRLYTRREPDGVVTHVPDYMNALAEIGTDALIHDIANLALELAQVKTMRPWLTATTEVLAQRASSIPLAEMAQFHTVDQFLDGRRQQQRRASRLTWEFSKVMFQPRSAPSVGDVIDIVIRHPSDPAPPPG